MALKDFPELPFRLGTTSYIIPDDILPNVRYLADKVDDIELVLFDVEDYSNLPSPTLVNELNRIAGDAGLTYTVHLPLDLKFTRADERADVSIEKALKTIGATERLGPIAYVAHLDSHQIGPAEREPSEELVENCLSALEKIAPTLPDRKKLAIENLESYPGEWNDEVIRRFGASNCVDIGHLWLRGRDPLPYLRERLPVTSVVHLHGIADRDHRSLTAQSKNQVQLIWQELLRQNYRGVVTLEIFNEADFVSSMDLLRSFHDRHSTIR